MTEPSLLFINNSKLISLIPNSFITLSTAGRWKISQSLKSCCTKHLHITSPNLWFFDNGIQISSSDESRGSSKTNLNEGRRQIAQADKISGTSARRQADPRDGIKFSFGERSRVTNYTYIHPFLPSTTRQIDFRPTMMPGFSSLETARAIRPPLRASPPLLPCNCNSNSGCNERWYDRNFLRFRAEKCKL